MLVLDIDHTPLCVCFMNMNFKSWVLNVCESFSFFILDFLLCFPNLIPFNYILPRAFTEVLQWETLTKAVIVN